MDITRSSLLSTMLYTALLVALFLWGSSLPEFYRPIDESIAGPSWDLIGRMINDNHTVERVVSAVLMFVISLLVAQLAIRNVIYLERTYMPSVIFVLISSAFYNTEHSLAPLLATYCLVIAFSQGLRSYPIKTLATRRILTSGVYLGIAALVYPPAVYLTPMIMVVLSMFRLGSFKEWIVGVCGVGVPLGIYFFVLWVLGGDIYGQWMLYYKGLTMSDSTVVDMIFTQLNVIQYTFIGVCLLLFVLSVVRFRRSIKFYKRRAALGFGFFVILSFWTAAVMVTSPVRSLYMLPLLALPLSIVIPTYFAASRPTFLTNFLYAILLLSAIAIHLV